MIEDQDNDSLSFRERQRRSHADPHERDLEQVHIFRICADCPGGRRTTGRQDGGRLSTLCDDPLSTCVAAQARSDPRRSLRPLWLRYRWPLAIWASGVAVGRGGEGALPIERPSIRPLATCLRGVASALSAPRRCKR